MIGFLKRAYETLRTWAGPVCLCVFLLLIRIVWGWNFFQAGKGKLLNIHKPIEFFTHLHIPMPAFNAWLVAIVEAVGGILLIVGLGSRAVAFALLFDMVIAYLTADWSAVKALFAEGDVPRFAAAAEFWFLVTSFLVLALGPGKASLDAVIERGLRRSNPPEMRPASGAAKPW